ncbi:MAG: 50S ribosomal protein L9 [Inquilinus sp.]|nr:50S ribosomal protein L9 [Inquilinus sp.]
MQVILLERIERLGLMGDVVTVKPGFARNFLLPKKKAMRATKDNIAYFETQKAHYEANNLERRKEAEGVGSKLDGVSIVVIRQAGDSGQLYGSVTARDIAEGLGEEGFTVDRSQVAIDRPIKLLGLTDVRIRLHAEVSVTVTVNVARSKDEAELQKEHGGAIPTMEMRERAEAEDVQAALEEQAAELLEVRDDIPADAEAAAEDQTEEKSEG